MASPPRVSPGVALGAGPYASQGMIAPSTPIVDGEGNLTGTWYRFLFGMFNQIQQLQSDIATIQQRLTNAGIP